MRTYRPHQQDALNCGAALERIAAGKLSATAEERDSLTLVINAYNDGAEVTQRCICRAHDAIYRMRGDASAERC